MQTYTGLYNNNQLNIDWFLNQTFDLIMSIW